jgi:hypothetical protein
VRKLAKKIFIPFQVILGNRPPQNLGGTEIETNLLGGVVVVIDGVLADGSYDDTYTDQYGQVTVITLGGTATNNNVLGGNATDPNAAEGGASVEQNVLGGAAVVGDPFAGTEVDWTMQEIDIHLAQFNDETLALTITSGGSAQNLTGVELDVFLKTKSGVADTDPSTIKLSTVTGEVVITNAGGGLATVAIPATDLLTLGIGFWRTDLVVSGKRNTAIFGTVSVTAL